MARSRSPSRRVQEIADRFPDTKAAGVVLWDEHGGFLVGYQPKTRKWFEPGGKKMVGESAISCAKRELHEETGLDTEKDVVIQWESPTYIPDCKYLFFLGRLGRGRPANSTTFSEYKFVPFDGLPAASSFRLQRVAHFLCRQAEERRRTRTIVALGPMLSNGANQR